MKKAIILYLVLLSSTKSFGHQDFYVYQKFGNIQTRIQTGYQYEQINVVKIIGKLAKKLSNKLNYNQPIFLDFNHTYTQDVESNYFLSYDKGVIEYTYEGGGKQKSVLKKKGIVIRQVAHEFEIETTLKLLEYAIANIEEIKQNQKEIIYEQNYCQWKVNTIDTLNIPPILAKFTSKTIENLIQERTYLHSNDWNANYNYFYQNRQFHFLEKKHSREKITDTIALSTSSLFQVTALDSGSKLVFDSDSTFYCIGVPNSDWIVSEKQTIKKVEDNYKPFDILYIGNDLIAITFSRFRTDEEWELSGKREFYYRKTSIYDERNDELLDAVRADIRKNKE